MSLGRSALTAGLLGLGAWAVVYVFSLRTSEPLGRPAPVRPVAVIGLDGADWQAIDPLIEAGLLPHLAALRREGAWAMLRSSPPLLSPLLWTTVATGRKPEDHGILDFLAVDPSTGRKLPVSSRSRKVKALWNIFSESARSSSVVGWWATWPAEPVQGAIVTERLAYQLFRFEEDAWKDEGKTHPPELLQEIEPKLVRVGDVTYEEVRRFLKVTEDDFLAARREAGRAPERRYSHPIVHFSAVLASTMSYHRAASHLLEEGQPDLFMVYFEGIDTTGHLFQRFAPPRMEGVGEEEVARYGRAVTEFYRFQDELLGEILGRLAPETTIILLSDHGFRSGAERPKVRSTDFAEDAALWHRLYGVFVLKGPGVDPGKLDPVAVEDIAPTVLVAAGLPVAEDMPGEPVQKRFAQGVEIATLPTYEGGARAVPGARAPPEELRAIEERLAALGYLSTDTATRHLNLGASYLASGDWDRAEEAFEQALEKSPRLTEARSGLIQVYLAQKRYTEALERSLELLRTEEVGPEVYLQTVELHLKTGKLESAEAILEEAVKLKGRSAELSVAAGEIELSRGRADLAEVRFHDALALDPGSSLAAERLLGILLRKGALEEALRMVRNALEVSPRSAYFLDKLGFLEMQRGNWARAEQALRAALSESPESPSAMANLGMCLAMQGRMKEAEEVLASARRSHPESFEATVNLASLWAKQGRPEEAVPLFEEALRLREASPEVLNSLGLAYLEIGREEDALKSFEKSLAAQPDQPKVTALVRELRSGEGR